MGKEYLLELSLWNRDQGTIKSGLRQTPDCEFASELIRPTLQYRDPVFLFSLSSASLPLLSSIPVPPYRKVDHSPIHDVERTIRYLFNLLRHCGNQLFGIASSHREFEFQRNGRFVWKRNCSLYVGKSQNYAGRPRIWCSRERGVWRYHIWVGISRMFTCLPPDQREEESRIFVDILTIGFNHFKKAVLYLGKHFFWLISIRVRYE